MKLQLPTAFLKRMERIIPLEYYPTFLASFTESKMTSFRVNTLKVTTTELYNELTAKGVALTPLSWYPEAFSVPAITRAWLTASAEVNSGKIYIQNPSSMFASLVLAPQPEEEVLDLAAAPGGKTLHLAALMQNRGRVAAVEAVKERFFRLKANVERSGATIIQLYCKDGRQIGRLVPHRFDRTLLDAPCSSEGRFDLKEPDSFSYWSEKKIQQMVRKQKQLIYSAIQTLKPNGILVYSTCSYAPEENEAIIDYALRKFPQEIDVLPIEVPFSNMQQGLTSWQGDNYASDLKHAVRILPNELMNGFFICKLVRSPSP